jgi:hypothetical protein
MFSPAEKLACCERELKYRTQVYARLVARGKMSDPQRHIEIALMEAIRDDYRELVAVEELPPFLFIETRRTVKQG